MRQGTVLFIDERETRSKDIDDVMDYISQSISRNYIYSTDIIILGDKIIKNRYGNNGTIVPPDYLEHPTEKDLRLRLLADIFREITGQKGVNI